MKEFINRSVYLGYYFKQLDSQKFRNFVDYVHKETGKSKSALWWDAIKSTYKYNIGLMDYFTFRFYEKDANERSRWVGTGYKYEFDLKSNPKETRDILEDKLKFYEVYSPFIKHKYCDLQDLKEETERAKDVLNNPSGKVVVKDSKGQCGWDVEVINASDYTLKSLLDYMNSKGFDMAEEFVVQHEKINSLSPSGLNTIRIFTMINDAGEVDFLGARMRVSVNSFVDNLASGNIACSVDLKTGIIDGKGIYSDITKNEEEKHPITGVKFEGFQIPMWDEILDVSRKIALHRPENRGVGWDIALTENGPDFIEGNHNWCKILWQLPVNKGMKDVLEQYHF